MNSSWLDLIEDRQMLHVISIAKNIANSKSTILLTGESGVGKEVMSKYIHQISARSKSPFVAINCAAIPENLLEAELFGYEKGAFTSAVQSKPGKFEEANNGTFLLDEISELPLLLQTKILRVVQEGELVRLGSNQVKKVNIRFICAANRDLGEMVERGQFRKDLYYRINVIPLKIPSLRFRPKDLKNLIKFFLRTISEENNLPNKLLTSEAWDKLMSWSWPGNIRELKNVIERSVLLSKSNDISVDEILLEGAEEKASVHFGPGMTVSQAEKLLILKTLEFTEQNRTKAAELLGISVRTLRNKLHEYFGAEGEING